MSNFVELQAPRSPAAINPGLRKEDDDISLNSDDGHVHVQQPKQGFAGFGEMLKQKTAQLTHFGTAEQMFRLEEYMSEKRRIVCFSVI